MRPHTPYNGVIVIFESIPPVSKALETALSNASANASSISGSRRPCLTAVLRMAGLRPTRQRLAIAETLYRDGHRHISAEQLHDEVTSEGVNVSLATIYNALHQFKKAGLLREISVDASKSYFDTNTSDHHHFYIEDEEIVFDIPSNDIVISGLPKAPKGMEVTHVDVVVRVQRV